MTLYCTLCFSFFTQRNGGLWFYSYSSSELPSDLQLTPASFLFLNSDQTFTLDFGRLRYGKWLKQNDTLKLHFVDGLTNAYLINYENAQDIKLTMRPGLVSDFYSAPASFKTENENPFSLQNNKWRLSATHKETPVEIRTRLINHCAFWKAYFLWAINDNIKYVDVRSTPTPIKIYGNGFALKTFDDLPDKWKNYFFDSADCRLASKMIEEVFEHENIAWANGDNKYIMFAGAFEQLGNFLRKESNLSIRNTQ